MDCGGYHAFVGETFLSCAMKEAHCENMSSRVEFCSFGFCALRAHSVRTYTDVASCVQAED